MKFYKTGYSITIPGFERTTVYVNNKTEIYVGGHDCLYPIIEIKNKDPEQLDTTTPLTLDRYMENNYYTGQIRLGNPVSHPHISKLLYQHKEEDRENLIANIIHDQSDFKKKTEDNIESLKTLYTKLHNETKAIQKHLKKLNEDKNAES